MKNENLLRETFQLKPHFAETRTLQRSRGKLQRFLVFSIKPIKEHKEIIHLTNEFQREKKRID